MDILEIRLEEGSLDLFPKASQDFYINKTNHNLTDLQTREASNSKSISVPLTLLNIRLLGKDLPSLATSVTTSAYNFIPCTVLMFGLPVLEDAQLYVGTESSKGSVQITVFGDQVLFFDRLSDNPISQLDWSEYNMDWTLANLVPFANTTEGFLFGNAVWSDNNSYTSAIAQGIDEAGTNLSKVDIQTAGGWLYMKTIFQKILDSIDGIEFDTNLIDNDLFDKMVLEVPVTQALENWTSIGGANGDVSNIGREFISGGASGDSIRIEFGTVNANDPSDTWEPAQNEFTAQNEGYYNIKFNTSDTDVYNVESGGTVFNGCKYVIYADNRELKTIFLDMTRKNQTRSVDFQAFLFAGEKIYLEFEMIESYSRDTEIRVSSQFSIQTAGQITTSFVNLSDWIPEISQSDFVREIFKFFHITLHEVENNTIQFDLWDKIPEAEEIDLTEYVDLARGIDKSGSILSYAQKNKFTYTNDEFVQDKGTSFEMQVLNEVLSDEKDVVVSKFSASDSCQNLVNPARISVPLFPYTYSPVTDNKIKITSGQDLYETNERNPIKVGDILIVPDNGSGFQRRRVINVLTDFIGSVDVNWSSGHDQQDWELIHYEKQETGIRIGTTSSAGQNTFYDGGSSLVAANSKSIFFNDELNWSSITDEFYPNLKRTLFKPLVSTMWLRLPIDIFLNLDFRKPVYVLDDRYYINKIEQYNTLKFCRFQLVRTQVEARVYDGEYSFDVTPSQVDSLDYGSWETGQAANTLQFTITNTGTEVLNIHTYFTGPQAQYFELTSTTPITVLVGGSVFVDTQFNGSEVPDLNSANINFIDSIAGNKVQKIHSLVTVYSYKADPEFMDFGEVKANENEVRIVTIKNAGSEELNFSFGSIIGSTDFSLLNGGPITLQPNDTHEIEVEFAASNPKGLKEASFNIIPVESQVSTTTINLQGITT